MNRLDTASNVSDDCLSDSSFVSNISGLTGYEEEINEIKNLLKLCTNTKNEPLKSSNETTYNKIDILSYENRISSLKLELRNVLKINDKYKNDLLSIERKNELLNHSKFEKLVKKNAVLEAHIMENANNYIQNVLKSSENSFSTENSKTTELRNKLIHIEKSKCDLQTEVNLLQNQSEHWKNEANLFKLDYEKLKTQNNEFQLDIKLKTNCINELKNKIAEQHTELHNCKQDSIKHINSCKSIISELECLKKSENWYKKQLHDCQNDKNKLYEELLNLKTVIIGKDKNFHELTIENNDWKGKYREISNDFEKYKVKFEKKLNSLEFDILNNKGNNFTEIGDSSKIHTGKLDYTEKGSFEEESLRQYYENELEILNKEIAIIRQAIMEQKVLFETINKQNSELLSRNTSQQKLLNDKEIRLQKYENHRNDFDIQILLLSDNLRNKEKEISILNSEVNKLEIAWLSANKEKEEIGSAIGLIRDDFHKFLKVYQSMKSDLEHSNKVILELQCGKQELFMSNNWNVCEIEEFKHREQDYLHKIGTLSQNNMEMKHNFNDLCNEKSQLDSKMIECSNQITLLMEQKVDLEKVIKTIPNLEKDICILRTENLKSEQMVQFYKKSIEELNFKLNELQILYVNLGKDSEIKLNDLQSIVASREYDINSFKTKLVEYEKNVAKFNIVISKNDLEIDSYKNMIVEFEKNNFDLKFIISEQESEIVSIKNNSLSLIKNISDLKSVISQKESEIIKIKDELFELKNQKKTELSLHQIHNLENNLNSDSQNEETEKTNFKSLSDKKETNLIFIKNGTSFKFENNEIEKDANVNFHHENQHFMNFTNNGYENECPENINQQIDDFEHQTQIILKNDSTEQLNINKTSFDFTNHQTGNMETDFVFQNPKFAKNEYTNQPFGLNGDNYLEIDQLIERNKRVGNKTIETVLNNNNIDNLKIIIETLCQKVDEILKNTFNESNSLKIIFKNNKLINSDLMLEEMLEKLDLYLVKIYNKYKNQKIFHKKLENPNENISQTNKYLIQKQALIERINKVEKKCILLNTKCIQTGSLLNDFQAHNTNKENHTTELQKLQTLIKVKDLETQEKLKRYETNNRTLLRKIKEHMRGRRTAEKHCNYLQEMYNSSMDEFNTTKLKLTQTIFEIEELQSVINNKNYVTEKLEHTVLRLEQEIIRENAQRVNVSTDNELLRNKLNDLECKLNDVENKLDASLNDIRAKEMTISTLKLQILELSNEHEKLQQEHSNCNTLQEEYVKDLENEKNIALKTSNMLETERTVHTQITNDYMNMQSQYYNILTELDIVKRDLKDSMHKNEFYSEEIKTISCTILQKDEELIYLQAENSKAIDGSTTNETYFQNLLKKLEVELKEERDAFKSVNTEKYFLQRLCNDLKMALHSTTNQNQVLKDKLSVHLKDSEFNSLPDLMINLPTPNKFDETYINQLLLQSNKPDNKPLTNLHDSLNSLKKEMAVLQQQIIQKNSI